VVLTAAWYFRFPDPEGLSNVAAPGGFGETLGASAAIRPAGDGMTKHEHVWLPVLIGTTWREVCIYACGVGYRRARRPRVAPGSQS
jgi:hypothetical protein